MRWFTVTLEMLHFKSYLIPIYNSHVYLQKTPLLFLLMIAGWKIFGVSLWWVWFLQIVISLLNAIMVYAIAFVLWKKHANAVIAGSLLLANY